MSKISIIVDLADLMKLVAEIKINLPCVKVDLMGSFEGLDEKCKGEL